MDTLRTEAGRKAVLEAAEAMGRARDAEMPTNPDVAMHLNEVTIVLFALAVRVEDR